MTRHPLIRLTFCGLLLALNACMTPELKMYQPKVSGPLVKSVAVLPFSLEVKLDEAEHPETIFRQVFYNYFSYLGYRDLAIEDVDHRLRQAGHTNPLTINKLSHSELKQILGVDAVIIGRVIDANNFTGGIYAETRIKATLELHDLNTGNKIWELEHHEMELSGIAQSTVVDMVQDQVDNSETRYAYFLSAEAFAIKALEQIPDPAKGSHEIVRPPMIHQIHANIRPGHLLQVGDRIDVTLVGAKGLSASFDIGSQRTRVPMKEIKPGKYVGSYQIKGNDSISRSLIIGRLKDKQGLVAKKIFRTMIEQVKV